MESIFDVWNCRSFIIFGRCLIAKSLGISQLVRTISNVNTSKACIQTLNSAIFKFICTISSLSITYHIMKLSYGKEIRGLLW